MAVRQEAGPLTGAGAALPDAPPGFVRRDVPSSSLYVRDDWAEVLAARGFDDPAVWPARTAPAERTSGRGGSTRIEIPGRPALRAKPMRRGGLLAPVWRDRFAGTARLLRNLTDPDEALRRGVATARAVALLLRTGAAGLFEGWLAVEEIPETEDLARRWAREPIDASDSRAVLGFLRRVHDAGLAHPDLNLGNLLMGTAPAAAPKVWIVDLDRVRWHDGPLPVAARVKALRRFERSCVKVLGWGAEDLRWRAAAWHTVYAAGDSEMLRKLRDSGGVVARLRLAIHRRRWVSKVDGGRGGGGMA